MKIKFLDNIREELSKRKEIKTKQRAFVKLVATTTVVGLTAYAIGRNNGEEIGRLVGRAEGFTAGVQHAFDAVAKK